MRFLGLPVAVTLSLLLMAKKMARNRVLVKNLTTVETLSCVDVIASDKTGTLTQNKMFVGSVAVGYRQLELKECHSEDPSGNAKNQLLSACRLCNNARFDDSEVEIPINQRKAIGDATDIALLRFGEENIFFDRIENCYHTIAEIPFNSRNKWMMKCVEPMNSNHEVHKKMFGTTEKTKIMFLKGAPDILLKKCTFIINDDGSTKNLDDDDYNEIIRLQNDWCMAGRRVLLMIKRECTQPEANTLITTATSEIENFVVEKNDFCVVGLCGIIDPPRENIAEVVAKCRGAGIRVMMVTGDYALTAAAIAHQVGIFTSLKYDTGI
jgi:sodium/potassium-transporting ATPase subunit alpha